MADGRSLEQGLVLNELDLLALSDKLSASVAFSAKALLDFLPSFLVNHILK